MLKTIWDYIKGIFQPDINSEIKERVTNPFFVSLAIAWSVWNWRLIFIVFNFDHTYTLDKKITKVQEYLNAHFWQNSLIFYPILSAFVAIIVAALLIQLSLLITVFTRRRLQPLIYKYVGHRSDIVDTKTHAEIKKRLYVLQDSYKSIQLENSEIVTENGTLRKDLRDEQSISQDYKLKKDIAEIELDIMKGKHTLNGIFDGKWFCNYIFEDGSTGKETAMITENIYLAQDKPKFKIDMIDVDKKEKKIRFRKVGITEEDKRVLLCDLNIIDDTEYSGTEANNILIRYSKEGNSKRLDFTPYYKNNKISVGDKTQIIFEFQNNVNNTLDVIAYTFSSKYNGEKYKTFPRHDYQKELIPSKEKVVDEFGFVNPLVEYFVNKKEPGIYDSEISIEYRVRGETQNRQVTRIARLVVEKPE